MTKETAVLFRNGRIIDPATNRDGIGDLLVVDGRIAGANAAVPADVRAIDVSGCWVVPGLIDMHVHLREPGFEYKETIASGCLAAAAGGFTGVACMPNTSPVNDSGTVTTFILRQAAATGVHVYPVAAISKGSQGKELAEYGELRKAGAVAVSDDGLPVMNSQLMRRALEYAGNHGLLVISHAEETSLAHGGVMNEGPLSTRLGLRGIPRVAEEIMICRDIALAEYTGQRVHIAHVSTAGAVELIRQAKGRGCRVTAETAPHYFSLTEQAVEGYNTNAKMNPPLRTPADVAAIKAGLADGSLDAIATDHAPHGVVEKDVEFDYAANGIIGLETALPLTLELVREGVISPARMVELLSVNPARILGVAGGSLTGGAAADITVIAPDRRYVLDAEGLRSKSRNTPFLGVTMVGKTLLTMVAGRIIHEEGRTP